MSTSRPLLIVQMGHPPAAIRASVGEQPQWFQAALRQHNPALRVVCPFEGEPLPALDEFSGAVISGSWAMVTTREPWSERTAGWIRHVMDADKPLLGICYGHQLMSWALGGEVDYHPGGREVGLKNITLNQAGKDDRMLGQGPERFSAFLSHEQSVLTPPKGVAVLASSDHDPHQALRYSPQALSVQFHPEFTPKIMNAIITLREKPLKEAPYPVAESLITPYAHGILERFSLYCQTNIVG